MIQFILEDLPMFKGIFVALITPFEAGQVNYKALAGLIERQIAAGVNGFVCWVPLPNHRP